MKRKFKNGSQINDLKSGGTNRGNRSNIMTTLCLDLETGETVFKDIDMREPLERYIPMYIVDQIMEERKNK